MTESLPLRVAFVSGACFAVVRLCFGLLGWYSRDHGDILVRKKIDKYWDLLYELTIYQVFNRALARLLNRIRETFGGPEVALIFAGPVIFIFSTGMCLIAFTLLLWDAPAFLWGDCSFACRFLRLAAWTWEKKPPLAVYIILISTLIGIASTILTWNLANRIIKASGPRTAGLHLVANFLVIGGAFGLLLFAVERAFNWPDYRWHGEFTQHLTFQAAITLEERPVIFLEMIMLLGIASALPTLTYISICGLAIFLWSLPDGARRFITHTLYLVSTEKAPVLTTVGNIFGGLAALCGLIFEMSK